MFHIDRSSVNFNNMLTNSSHFLFSLACVLSFQYEVAKSLNYGIQNLWYIIMYNTKL